jgi:predicted secreted protein
VLKITSTTWIASGIGVAMFLLAGVAHAQEQSEARNRVSFQVAATRQVANDRVEALLVASAEASDAADCASQVNDAMTWALDRARGKTGVSVYTSGYSTQPLYDEGRLRRWRARQELVLSASDPEALTELVGKLQERLALQAFTFSVSDERRRKTEDALIEEALAGFGKRADLIRRSLGARAWRIDEVGIDAGRGGPVPRLQQARMAEGVAVEAGTSRVQVQVRATIVLE